MHSTFFSCKIDKKRDSQQNNARLLFKQISQLEAALKSVHSVASTIAVSTYNVSAELLARMFKVTLTRTASIIDKPCSLSVATTLIYINYMQVH